MSGTVELTLNKEPYNTVDAKCLEVEMSHTELLAAPSSNIRKRTIKVAMDSGAGDHVASPEDVEGFAVEESQSRPQLCGGEWRENPQPWAIDGQDADSEWQTCGKHISSCGRYATALLGVQVVRRWI